tara:strand:+ start:119 stop:325 length:207 start_codon:yes stop_codon:yes gene_type:complete
MTLERNVRVNSSLLLDVKKFCAASSSLKKQVTIKDFVEKAIKKELSSAQRNHQDYRLNPYPPTEFKKS